MSDFTFIRLQSVQDTVVIPEIGLALKVIIPESSTSKNIEVIETTNQPGFGPPRHRHPQTEIFRVLEGRYLFDVNGDRFYAEPGDVVTVPGNLPHAFVNAGKTPAKQLVIITPGFNSLAFFTALGEFLQNNQDGLNGLILFGKDWGVDFLGLPLQP